MGNKFQRTFLVEKRHLPSRIGELGFEDLGPWQQAGSYDKLDQARQHADHAAVGRTMFRSGTEYRVRRTDTKIERIK